jgi:hypothetical protein
MSGIAGEEQTMAHEHPTDWQQEAIVGPLNDALEAAGIYLATEIRDGRLFLAGEVESAASREAALDLASAIARRHGLTIDDSIETMESDVDADYPTRSEENLPGFGLDDSAEEPQEEELFDTTAGPSTVVDVGTIDPEEAAEEGIPYFPPTDPMVRPDSGPEKLAMINGFSPTSVDDFGDAGDGAGGLVPQGDEQLADDIRRELREDALTVELAVDVQVRNSVVYLRGVVETLDDAENAEAVAARVPGVESVVEQLEVLNLRSDRQR